MRFISNSVMAALVVAALFWGNCFSCPQALLAAQIHKCCHHTKAPAAGCQLQNLQHFVKAPTGDQAAAPVVAQFAKPIAPVLLSQRDDSRPVTVQPTPPDLLTLRI
jgi:hypothetical protein